MQHMHDMDKQASVAPNMTWCFLYTYLVIIEDDPSASLADVGYIVTAARVAAHVADEPQQVVAGATVHDPAASSR